MTLYAGAQGAYCGKDLQEILLRGVEPEAEPVLDLNLENDQHNGIIGKFLPDGGLRRNGLCPAGDAGVRTLLLDDFDDLTLDNKQFHDGHSRVQIFQRYHNITRQDSERW